MEKFIAVRDCVFWWTGCWALITGADAAVITAALWIMRGRAAARRGPGQPKSGRARFFDQDAIGTEDGQDGTAG